MYQYRSHLETTVKLWLVSVYTDLPPTVIWNYIGD